MNTKIKIDSLSFTYSGKKILHNICLDIEEKTITAITGSSGRGKSTLLTIFNRLWENIPGAKVEGSVEISFEGSFCKINDRAFSLQRLRRSVGTVFQTPNPLPMSVFKNTAFPLKLAGIKKKNIIEQRVEEVLRKAFLWDEVKDRLRDDARMLSGGQQQRLCIARALITEPDILLLDEPTSSLDEKSTAVIEKLLLELRGKCTILMVSHHMEQVRRTADRVLELVDGKLVEQASDPKILEYAKVS